MLFQLLGDQVILGDHHLFLIGIRTQLNDLHTIQQRSGNGIQCIGRCNKHDLRQIKGDLDIMIPVGVILLAIQNFQQCGAGISPEILAHFVNLIQQDQCIFAARLGQCRHDPSRHSANIGLAMTPDVRFIMDTAKRDPRHFPVQAFCDGIGNGGLADTGRAYQADDLRRHIGSHLAYRNGLQDTLLHLLHAKVILLQDLSGSGYIHPFFGGCRPGQIQNGIQIIPQDSSLLRTKGLLFQSINVF